LKKNVDFLKNKGNVMEIEATLIFSKCREGRGKCEALVPHYILTRY
jgi:hypothetical protein